MFGKCASVLALLSTVLLAVPAFAGPMWAFEDQAGVLHLSDRKLDDRYVRVNVPGDSQRLGFDHIRMAVRAKNGPKPADPKAGAVFMADVNGARFAKAPGVITPASPVLNASATNGQAARVLGPATSAAPGFHMWPPIAMPGGPGGKSGVRQPYQKPDPVLMQFIRGAGNLHGVEPELIYAVIETESNFQNGATSPKGAQGLMQIMPSTGKDLGLFTPFDPARNIEAGTRYLRAMYDRFGDARLALAAYNAGPGSVEQHRGVPPYAETQQYVVKVLDRWRALKTQGMPIRPAVGQ